MSNVSSLVDQCIAVIVSTDNFIQLNRDGIKALPLDLLQRILQNIVVTVQSKLLTQTLALKIRLIRENRIVTFRFKLHGLVKEAVEYIYDRIGGTSNDGNEPYL
jgi:hypothetical protein